MGNSNDPTQSDRASSNLGDMEQVRQLLLGDHQAAQERQISALQERVTQLETLVDALIAHGDTVRRAWQADVATLKNSGGREVGSRSVLQQVTPLTPRTGEGDASRHD